MRNKIPNEQHRTVTHGNHESQRSAFSRCQETPYRNPSLHSSGADSIIVQAKGYDAHSDTALPDSPPLWMYVSDALQPLWLCALLTLGKPTLLPELLSSALNRE